jgi:ribosomal protein S18 acetylase RimI-like enzyme
MEIRSLDFPDFEGLFSLVSGVYEDSPLAMWFISKPERESFRAIFGHKIAGIVEKNVVDLVAVEEGRIIGECEIVRRNGEIGILGIIISKDHRRRGIGGILFSEASKKAEDIRIYKIRAEVAESNGGAMIFLSKKGFSMNGTMPRETPQGIRNITLLRKEI